MSSLTDPYLKKAKFLEQCVLKYIIHNPIGLSMETLSKKIQPEFFLHEEHRILYNAYYTAYVNGNEVLLDIVRNAKLLEIHNSLREIAYDVPVKIVSYFSELVSNYEKYRSLDIYHQFHEDKISSDELDEQRAQLRLSLSPIIPKNNLTLHDDFVASNKRYDTVPVRFSELNEKTSGLEKGKLWVVSGYTSGKKTWFALHLFLDIISSDKKVDFYSLEMSEQELFSRMISIDSGHNAALYARNSNLDKETTDILMLASQKLSAKTNYAIYKDHRTFSKIMTNMRRKHKAGMLDYVIIDYAQNIKESGMKEEYDRIGHIGRTLQDFSQETGVTVILLSQVSNEHAKEPGNNVISTKGSGDLAASADVVIELYVDKEQRQSNEDNIHSKSEQITCHVRKNRHGPNGKLTLLFDTTCGKLTGVSPLDMPDRRGNMFIYETSK